MEQEVPADVSLNASHIASKGIKFTFLALVWIPFLGSSYITITHLMTWLKTGLWPSYSTANLFGDLQIAHPKGSFHGIQPAMDWVMAEPAAYLLMGLAIVFSVMMALLVDD